MLEQNWLISPTLNLFSYDSRSGEEQREKIQKNHPERLPSPFYGYQHQHILGNSYALHIHCTDPTASPEALNPKSIGLIQQLKQTILENHTSDYSSLGKTWVLFGKATNERQTTENLAKYFYQKLEPASRLTNDKILIEKGNIYEIQIFEFWQKIEQEQRYAHYVMCFFADNSELSAKPIKDLYHHFMKIFLYRHKFFTAYEKARQAKREILQNYQLAQEVSLQLKGSVDIAIFDLYFLQISLTNTLRLLDVYIQNLSEISMQIYIMEFCIDKYIRRYKKIQKLDETSNLKVFERFMYSMAKYYLNEVEQNYKSLEPGLSLLENIIYTITGLIDLQTATNQQRLSKTIVAVGMGVGASVTLSNTLAKTSSPTPPQDNSEWFSVFSHSSASLAVGVFLGAFLKQLFSKKG